MMRDRIAAIFKPYGTNLLKIMRFLNPFSKAGFQKYITLKKKREDKNGL